MVQFFGLLTSEQSEEVPFLRFGEGRARGSPPLRMLRSKSGGRHGGRATKFGPKVRLLKTPVPTVGFRDPAHAARAIAGEARLNTRFRAKVAQGIVAKQ